MVKFIGSFCGGYHQQRGADRTLITVRGTVDDRDGVRALFLCREGGGAAAIQVDRYGAARIQHDLSYLLCASACRERLLTAVKNHQHHFAVSGNADAGSGSSGIVVIR